MLVDKIINRMLKTPKGTSDSEPKKKVLRDQVISIIEEIFIKHGAEPIDTPVFERRDVLTKKYATKKKEIVDVKVDLNIDANGEINTVINVNSCKNNSSVYGEESKLIYNLEDQGGEILSLRYDLTVPFARYITMRKIQKMKKYQIGRVYRRETVTKNKMRLREFYQADFDIVGDYKSMIPDAECLKVITEILTELNIGEFIIKLNHRGLLEMVLVESGIQKNMIKTVCSTIDKKDKIGLENVYQELLTKGVEQKCIDKLSGYLSISSEKLFVVLYENERFIDVLDEIKTLFEYLKVLKVKVDFDISLARGLDYYTGIIYEAMIVDCKIGSVAAGGRYDKMLGMFHKKGRSVPCVGLSIGIDRLLPLYQIDIKTKETQVYVTTLGTSMIERLRLYNNLIDTGIKTEISYKEKVKAINVFQYCEQNDIPFIVILGKDELQRGVVKIRYTKTREEIFVERDSYVQHIVKLLI
jgi:histidyl-tRNA synthetase